MTSTDEWAATLVDDNLSGRDFHLPWGGQTPTLEQAYAVQDAVFAGLTAQRGPLGGYKVAITAKPMQEMMGLSEPLGGLVHAGDINESPFTLSRASFHSPAIEFEVSVRLGRNVAPGPTPFTRDSIAPFVGQVLVSFEIVDTRGGDLPSVGAAGLVADRCLCSGAVLGSALDDWSNIDLATSAVEVVWNGEVVDTGVTGAALGHPFEGLAWVANHLTTRARELKAGDIVLTGSAFAPKPVAVGDEVTYRIAGIGEATINVVP